MNRIGTFLLAAFALLVVLIVGFTLLAIATSVPSPAHEAVVVFLSGHFV